jgi:hypothetical protein
MMEIELKIWATPWHVTEIKLKLWLAPLHMMDTKLKFGLCSKLDVREC